MTFDVAAWLLVISASAAAGLMVAIAAVRAVASVRRRRAERAHAAVLPLLLEVVDGVDVPLPTGRPEARAMGAAASGLVHKLRGADRDALGAWLGRHGFREVARAGLWSRRPARRAAAIELHLALGEDAGPVVALLRDRDPRVRVSAARALGEAGVVSAVPALVAAATSRTRPVSASAAAMAIVQAGPSSAAALGTAWRSRDPRALRLAADVSGHLGLADARPHLERLLLSPDHVLRTRAALALGRAGSPSSVPALRATARTAAPGSEEARALAESLAALTEPEETP